MLNTIRKSMLALTLTLLGLVPAMSWAVIAIKTEIVSGNIVQNNTDHSVLLDNGIVYYPVREELVINVPIGKPVTLRYALSSENKNIFSEFAPGLNSLQEIAVPTPKNNLK
jgi:hypothetical protein